MRPALAGFLSLGFAVFAAFGIVWLTSGPRDRAEIEWQDCERRGGLPVAAAHDGWRHVCIKREAVLP